VASQTPPKDEKLKPWEAKVRPCTTVKVFSSLFTREDNLARAPVAAGTFEDAVAADEGGDYATGQRQ
jgi:hypothetical protein